MSMKYVAGPAVCSDMLFSYLLYFNLNDTEGLEHFINPKRRAADVKFFRDTMAKFDIPDEALSPFFTIYNTSSFAFGGIFNALCLKQDCSFEQIGNYLPDAQTMISEVLRFYLPDMPHESPSLATLNEAIAALETTPLVKFHLLSMAVDPAPYYTLLTESLARRYAQMEAYYRSHTAAVERVSKALDEAALRTFMAARYGVSEEALGEELAYSVLLLGRNAVRFVPGEDPLVLIGTDYTARMEQLMAEAVQPDIVKVGKALSEEKRVMVLQLLLHQKEITAQQLLRELELSMTATHYHLELLLQAGMLLTRNEGRTIYYSLNRRFFDTAPTIFERFSTKG